MKILEDSRKEIEFQKYMEAAVAEFISKSEEIELKEAEIAFRYADKEMYPKIGTSAVEPLRAVKNKALEYVHYMKEVRGTVKDEDEAFIEHIITKGADNDFPG